MQRLLNILSQLGSVWRDRVLVRGEGEGWVDLKTLLLNIIQCPAIFPKEKENPPESPYRPSERIDAFR